jgi:hypothetical protein
MKFFKHFVIATLLAVTTSCTLDKTYFEAEINRDVTEYFEFKEVTSFNSGNYKISIEALNGTFYKGYNEIRLTILNTQTNLTLNNSDVTFYRYLPIPITLKLHVRTGIIWFIMLKNSFIRDMWYLQV